MLQLCALLLGMPDKGSLALLREMASEHAWLEAAVAELTALPLQQWQAEHTRLFISGHPQTPCAPFESIHRHGQMQGPACDELAQLYQTAGVTATSAMPTDYLGTMLEFAALLLERGTPAAQLQLAQLRELHLAKWLPQFCDQLRQQSRLLLYREFGQRLGAWIQA